MCRHRVVLSRAGSAPPVRGSDGQYRPVISMWRFLIVVALLVVTSQLSSATQPGSFRDVNDTCQRCAVTLSKVTTLSSAGPDGIERRPVVMARTRRGLVVVHAGASVPRMQVFEESGRPRGNLALTGEGPGRIARPVWLEYGDDDSLRVYEGNRVLVFGPTLQHARDARLKHPIAGTSDLARLASGITAFIPNAGGVGARVRLRLRRADGDTIRTVTLQDTVGWVVTQRLAASRARGRVGFWLARASKDSLGYLVSWVDSTGRVSPRFRRQPSWWYSTPKPEPVVTWRRGPNGTMVPSRDSSDAIPRLATVLADIRESKHGLFYAIIDHASEQWNGITLRNISSAPVTETVLEVIDPVSGTLVGAARVSGDPIGFLDDETLATYREHPDGDFDVDLWRITITR